MHVHVYTAKASVYKPIFILYLRVLDYAMQSFEGCYGL